MVERKNQLEQAAKSGSLDALLAMAAMKLCGIVYEKNEPEGIALLQKLAGLGNSSAQFLLHGEYAEGIGVEKNDEQALKWLRQASKIGSADAQAVLGMRYANGEGVNKDPAEARRWLSMAAAHGSGYAKFGLTALDTENHVSLTQQAAEAGDPQAQGALARMYDTGVTGALERNESQALKWRTKAAEGGFAESQRQLGDLYREMPGHRDESLRWYRLAAMQGEFESQMRLGGLLQYSDPLESHKWYLMAADRGDVTALYAVARQLAEGPAELRNEAEAFMWYRKLARIDFRYAAAGLSALYKNDTNRKPIPGLAYILELIGRRQHTQGLDWALEVFPSPEISALPPEEIESLRTLLADLVKPGNFMDALDAFVRSHEQPRP